MISVAECIEEAALRPHEFIVGVVSSVRRDLLLSVHLLNMSRGAKWVGDMIVADLRCALRFGLPRHAGDLLIVFRLFFAARKDRGRTKHYVSLTKFKKG